MDEEFPDQPAPIDASAVEMRLLAPVHLSGRTLAGEILLRSQADDPHAVTAVIDTGEGSVSWLFDRSLLQDGLKAPSGEGLVTAVPARDSSGRRFVVVYLHGDSGSMRVDVDAGPLTMFLDISSRHVHTDGCADRLAAEIEAFLTD